MVETDTLGKHKSMKKAVFSSFSKRIYSVVIPGILVFGIALLLQAHASIRTEVPEFFGLQPGKTSKAEVDLILGEPTTTVDRQKHIFTYSPPPGAEEINVVTIRFFADDFKIARIDALFQSPVPADPLREMFGTRLLRRTLEDGRAEELFYPRIQGIILPSPTDVSTVTAVSFLSSRYLADIYVERFNDLLHVQKRLEDTLAEAEKAIIIAPQYARGYLAKGQYFEEKKDYDQAIEFYLKATNCPYSDDTIGKGFFFLGTVYHKLKKYKEAENAFLKGIDFFPSYVNGRYWYAELLKELKKPEALEKQLETILAIDKNDLSTRYWLATFLWEEKKKNKEALSHLKYLVDRIGKDPDIRITEKEKSKILFRYAYYLNKTGEYEKSNRYYQKILEFKPNYHIALNNIGWNYYSMKDYAKAEIFYRKTLAIKQDYLITNKNMANLFFLQKRYNESLAYFRKILQLEPKMSQNAYNVARAFAALKKKESALKFLNQAVKAGYKNKQNILKDPYFKFLRNNREFIAIVK